MKTMIPAQDRNQLLLMIEEAFRDVPAPDDDLITEMEDPESLEIAECLKGIHWKELDLSRLGGNLRECIFFISPAAYRFYLPAFMTACIKDEAHANTLIHSLIGSLTPPRSGEDKDLDRFLAKTAEFDRSQKDVVCAFLQFVSSEFGDIDPYDDANWAREQFWGVI